MRCNRLEIRRIRKTRITSSSSSLYNIVLYTRYVALMDQSKNREYLFIYSLLYVMYYGSLFVYKYKITYVKSPNGAYEMTIYTVIGHLYRTRYSYKYHNSSLF